MRKIRKGNAEFAWGGGKGDWINGDDNHVNMIKQLMEIINFFTGDEISEKDEKLFTNEGYD